MNLFLAFCWMSSHQKYEGGGGASGNYIYSESSGGWSGGGDEGVISLVKNI